MGGRKKSRLIARGDWSNGDRRLLRLAWERGKSNGEREIRAQQISDRADTLCHRTRKARA